MFHLTKNEKTLLLHRPGPGEMDTFVRIGGRERGIEKNGDMKRHDIRIPFYVFVK